ncbi:MAG: hypothetical protein JSU65_12495 [Candidatus Zixiibacteriota bacterium]|nr:MAG: hypothetical protein JSU65_12495 [candidate division Zixibacteria bacterium]
MTQNLEQLIQKIQSDGVKAAEDKAREIEAEARARAEKILATARAEAETLTNEGKTSLDRMQRSGEEALRHAARDTLLALRKEIETTLDRLVTLEVRRALDVENVARIVSGLIDRNSGDKPTDVVVAVSDSDLSALRQTLMSTLKQEVMKGLTLAGSEDINGGFTISYDGGKSRFEFTDVALAQYLGTYLKPKLAEIIKDTVSDE